MAVLAALCPGPPSVALCVRHASLLRSWGLHAPCPKVPLPRPCSTPGPEPCSVADAATSVTPQFPRVSVPPRAAQTLALVPLSSLRCRCFVQPSGISPAALPLGASAPTRGVGGPQNRAAGGRACSQPSLSPARDGSSSGSRCFSEKRGDHAAGAMERLAGGEGPPGVEVRVALLPRLPPSHTRLGC